MNIENFAEIKRCKRCGVIIVGGSMKRVFCSKKCNKSYHALKRYHKIKNDVEFKEHRKEYFKVWLLKNRDRFNDSMRKAALKYQARKRMQKKLDEIRKEGIGITNNKIIERIE